MLALSLRMAYITDEDLYGLLSYAVAPPLARLEFAWHSVQANGGAGAGLWASEITGTVSSAVPSVEELGRPNQLGVCSATAERPQRQFGHTESTVR